MKYAAAVVAAGALLFPSFAIANGHISDDPHPGADKQQPATHGDCKNPGSKSDTHDTTGNHNGYDCSEPGQPPECNGDGCAPPPCSQNCQPQPPPACASCQLQQQPQSQPCPCACPAPTPPHHKKRHHKKRHHRRHHGHHHHTHHHKHRVPIFTG